MSVPTQLRAPFPWYGSKRAAAGIIWRLLGDPSVYIEPFAGSIAVLLARPVWGGGRTEVINDADGWLINAWRAIQMRPEEVVDHAMGPLVEADVHARLAWLAERRGPELISWLEGDPTHCDARAAGWYVYALSASIAHPFAGGPWRVVDGRLRRVGGRGVQRSLPHLTSSQGIFRFSSRGEAVEYMSRLSCRLRDVRILCSDWRRAVSPSALSLAGRGDGGVAIFFDPPYSGYGERLYAEAVGGVSADVREWCRTAPEHLRIVLAGYGDEHDDLAGWRKIEGVGGRGRKGDPGRRSLERLWCSPACLVEEEQVGLFDDAAEEDDDLATVH